MIMFQENLLIRYLVLAWICYVKEIICCVE